MTYDALYKSYYSSAPIIKSTESDLSDAIYDAITQIFNPVSGNVKSRVINFTNCSGYGLMTVWNMSNSEYHGFGQVIFEYTKYTIVFGYIGTNVTYQLYRKSDQQINSSDYIPTSALVYSMNTTLTSLNDNRLYVDEVSFNWGSSYYPKYWDSLTITIPEGRKLYGYAIDGYGDRYSLDYHYTIHCFTLRYTYHTTATEILGGTIRYVYKQL